MSPAHIEIILKLLDLVAIGAKMAPEVMEQYHQSRGSIENMIKEGREPTQAEWDSLLSSVQENTDKLNGAV